MSSITKHIRLGVLIAITLVVITISILGYFRSYSVGCSSVEIMPGEPIKGVTADDKPASIPSWDIIASDYYCSVVRGRISIVSAKTYSSTYNESALERWRSQPRFAQQIGRKFVPSDPWFQWTSWTEWRFAGFGPFRTVTALGVINMGMKDCGLHVPNWLLVGTMGMLWFRRWRRWRATRRTPTGSCPTCNYDLRGSPPIGTLVKCPECGNATAVTDSGPESDSAAL